MQPEEPIDLADLLATGEVVLEVPADQLQRVMRVAEAESALAAPWFGWGDTLFYETPAERAAVLCSRIVRNHPLPDGNKRAAFLLMLEALGRAGLTFVYLDATPDDVSEVIERLASRDLSEADFLVCSASTSPRGTRRLGSRRCRPQ